MIINHSFNGISSSSNGSPISFSEFEEGTDSEELFEIDIHRVSDDKGKGRLSTVCAGGEDVVYVAVKIDSESSMKALTWTLEHAVTPFTKVCLLHVFRKVRLIPTPVGKLPRGSVDTRHVNGYLALKKEEKKMLLRKFTTLCNVYKTTSEILLIEDDNVEIALTDLIKDLSIRKLVAGISKSNLSKVGSRRSSGIAEKLLKKAPEICNVKVLCEGKDVMDRMIIGSPSGAARENDRSHKPIGGTDTGHVNDAKILWVSPTKFLSLT